MFIFPLNLSYHHRILYRIDDFRYFYQQVHFLLLQSLKPLCSVMIDKPSTAKEIVSQFLLQHLPIHRILTKLLVRVMPHGNYLPMSATIILVCCLIAIEPYRSQGILISSVGMQYHLEHPTPHPHLISTFSLCHQIYRWRNSITNTNYSINHHLMTM